MFTSEKINDRESMVKIAAIQMHPVFGDVKGNVAKAVEKIREAAGQGAKLIVLPELFNTGYMFNSREECYSLAEHIPGGYTYTTLESLAKELDIYLVAGITELDSDDIRMYNTAVLIGPDGFIGKHHKLHLWCDDKIFFEPGDLGYQVFQTKIGRIGLLVCYDMWFFENFRILAKLGADIVCIPTNWVAGPVKEHPTTGPSLAEVNAVCNNIYIVAADRIGTERECTFPGLSVIAAPDGTFKAGPASTTEEEILYAEVNLMDSRRLNWNRMNVVFRDRRTDLYDDMLGSGLTPTAK